MGAAKDTIKIIQEIITGHSLKDISLIETMDLEEYVVIVIKGSVGNFIGKEGKILRELNKGLDKRVRVVEKTKNLKKMMQDLAGKARVIGVNKVFYPGETLYKVKIDYRDKNRLMLGEECFSTVMHRLLGENSRIEFVK